MIDQGASNSYNDCNILDFDSDLLESNNFGSLSPTENNNARYEEVHNNFYGKIEKMVNEKILIQNQCNSKVVDLQTQVMKLTNHFERVETSKVELEVELAKYQKELRFCQRSIKVKCSDMDTLKEDFSNQIKTLEGEFSIKLSHANDLNRVLQDQIFEEKRNNSKNQGFLSDKVNQLLIKLQEKEEELKNKTCNESILQQKVSELELKVKELDKQVEVSEQTNSTTVKELNDKNQQIESLKLSEIKLKSLVSDLTSKINQLETKIFEEKYELNESKNHQNNLQSQLLEIQFLQINKEKEYNMLIDKAASSNKRVKELEDILKNQIQLSTSYNDQLKKFQIKHELETGDIEHKNESLYKKIAELEETVHIQNRIIEETHQELSSSREDESLAISNLQLTLNELDKLIEEPKKILSPGRTHNSPKLVSGYLCSSPKSQGKVCFIPKEGDNQGMISPNKRIIRNVKQIIQDFQQRINSMDGDRLESSEKLQNQNKEIKNLKFQLRKYASQNKILEMNNDEKQKEIDSLKEEISKLKTLMLTLKTENFKSNSQYKNSIDSLKTTISRISEESENNMEIRDKYLQNISSSIKEALEKTLSPYFCSQKGSFNQSNNTKLNFDTVVQESSTQTKNLLESIVKDNLEFSGNLSGIITLRNQEKINHESVVKSTENNSLDHKSANCQPITDDKRKTIRKKNIKLSENKNESYMLDTGKGWPVLRDIISNELAILLHRYDLQKTQCHNLMTELSSKENIISRLLSQPHSNLLNKQGSVETNYGEMQENGNEVLLNKSANKFTFSNQSNLQIKNPTESKRKSKLSIKSRFDNKSGNIAVKQCKRLDNQKPCCSINLIQTEKCVPINKKATTTSIKVSDKSIVDQWICDSTVEPIARKRSNLSVKKLTTISLPNMLPVTLKCPKIVDIEQSTQTEMMTVDRRLVTLFFSTMLNLIHLQSDLENNRNLRIFYKLLYHRSVDCSKLISINDYIETIINRSCDSFGHVPTKRKIKKLKVLVHVISACSYMSRLVMATKLMVNPDNAIKHPYDFENFFLRVFNNVPNLTNGYLVSKVEMESISIDFIEFCKNNDYSYELIQNPWKKSRKNIIFTPSNNIVLEKLRININLIKTIIESQISKDFFKSKKKSYQNNIQTLIDKIKDMGQIIDDQNGLLLIKEKSICQMKEILSQKTSEIKDLQSLIKQQETLCFKKNCENEKLNIYISKTKSYLGLVINLVEQCQKSNFFDYSHLMVEEESIYKSLNSEHCDDFIDFVRDGIRMAFQLSCSVKSILL